MSDKRLIEKWMPGMGETYGLTQKRPMEPEPALRPPKWSPPQWPTPSDFDAMSEREFKAFVIRIGMDANIRHALKGHRWGLLLALGVGAALGFVAGWVAR